MQPGFNLRRRRHMLVELVINQDFFFQATGASIGRRGYSYAKRRRRLPERTGTKESWRKSFVRSNGEGPGSENWTSGGTEDI